MSDPDDLTYKELCKEYDPIINELIVLAQPEDPTIFDISGYPHYEDVISNWYAFFFDPAAEHSLDDLFLQSLVVLINKYKEFSMEGCLVKREFPTDKGGSIDLLLYEQTGEAGQFKSAIIIENKINAPLNNDLDDYFSSVKVKSDQKAGIVLSLNNINDLPEKFINITHERLLEVIQRNLGKYFVSAKPRYILYLQDFISNLERKKKMSERTKYYFEHGKKIDPLLEIRSDAYTQLRVNLQSQCDNEPSWKVTDYSSPTDRHQYIKLETSKRQGIWCFLDHPEIFGAHKFSITIYLSEDATDEVVQRIHNRLNSDDVFKSKLDEKVTIKSNRGKGARFLAQEEYKAENMDFIENFGERVLEILRRDWSEFLEKVTEHLHLNKAISHDTGA